MIDAAGFAILTPSLTSEQRASILPSLQRAMSRFGINTPKREAHFLAQVLHESGRFRYRRELASGAAYEGRRDLGNTQPGDGRRFRGRGWIQITGRANYHRFGAVIGVPIEAHPELAETDENAALLAVAFWDSRGLNSLADRDDLLGITKRINGGFNGLADRRNCLTAARKVLVLHDDDPSEDETEHTIPILLRGDDLDVVATLKNGASWAPLRALCAHLGLVIQSVGGTSAMVSKKGAPDATSVPLEIDGSTGYSPIRQVVSIAGLQVKMEAGKILIFD